MELSDEEIIYNIYLGNKEAERLLYFCFEKKMRPITNKYKYALNKEGFIGDDLKAIIWEVIGNALKKYNINRGHFYAYCAVLLNTYLVDLVEKNRAPLDGKCSYKMDDEGISDGCYSLEDSSIDYDARYNLNDIVLKAKNMGEEYYKVLLYVFDGYSYEEIASKMNVNKKRVENILYFFRKNIRKNR